MEQKQGKPKQHKLSKYGLKVAKRRKENPAFNQMYTEKVDSK